MGKGKPRHNPDKPQNNFKHCTYDDGTRGKECVGDHGHISVMGICINAENYTFDI